MCAPPDPSIRYEDPDGHYITKKSLQYQNDDTAMSLRECGTYVDDSHLTMTRPHFTS